MANIRTFMSQLYWRKVVSMNTILCHLVYTHRVTIATVAASFLMRLGGTGKGVKRFRRNLVGITGIIGSTL